MRDYERPLRLIVDIDVRELVDRERCDRDRLGRDVFAATAGERRPREFRRGVDAEERDRVVFGRAAVRREQKRAVRRGELRADRPLGGVQVAIRDRRADARQHGANMSVHADAE